MGKKERVQKLAECIIRLFTEANLDEFHRYSYDKAKKYMTEEVKERWAKLLK